MRRSWILRSICKRNKFHQFFHYFFSYSLFLFFQKNWSLPIVRSLSPIKIECLRCCCKLLYVQQITAYHNACSSLASFAMHNCDVFSVLRQPPVNVLAKRFQHFELRWIVIVERIDRDSLLELLEVVRSFGTAVEIISLLPCTKIERKKEQKYLNNSRFYAYRL